MHHGLDKLTAIHLCHSNLCRLCHSNLCHYPRIDSTLHASTSCLGHCLPRTAKMHSSPNQTCPDQTCPFLGSQWVCLCPCLLCLSCSPCPLSPPCSCHLDDCCLSCCPCPLSLLCSHPQAQGADCR